MLTGPGAFPGGVPGGAAPGYNHVGNNYTVPGSMPSYQGYSM